MSPAMAVAFTDRFSSVEDLVSLGIIRAAEDGKNGVIDKYESRRIRGEIRHVLMDVWDPIGIKDVPRAKDEYDGYLGGGYELLVGRASDEDLEEHLWRIVTERMGLSAAKKSDMADTVKALRQIPLSQNPK